MADEEVELDVSAVEALGEACREFRRAHRVADGAIALVPRYHALCVNVEAVELGEAATRATNAAMSERLRAFLDGGFAHPSERASAPEKLASAIDTVSTCVKQMENATERAGEALREFVEATSGRRDVDDEDGEHGKAHWIADVPVPVMLTAFRMGTSDANDALTVEQWLWACTSVVEQLEKELETRRAILRYLRSADPQPSELEGAVALWSAQPFLDDRLFALVCADAQSDA